jgi:hypothetical protein
MKPHRIAVIALCACLLATSAASLSAQTAKPEPTGKLLVVWTNQDREVALHMVFMYVFNGKQQGWWKDVTLLIWGPSQKLLSQDAELQAYVKKMKDAGVVLLACKQCADEYKLAPALTALGVDVKYMGAPLTDMIKSGWTVLTF